MPEARPATGPSAGAADRPDARRGGRGPRGAHWATTGGSTPAAIYRGSRRRRSATRSLGAGAAVVGRRPLRPARPSALERPGRDVRPARDRRAERQIRDRRGRARTLAGAAAARRSRPATSTRCPSPARSPGAKGRAGPRSATSRSSPPTGPARRRRPGVRPRAARRRAGRPHPVGLPGLRGVRPAEGRSASRPRRTSSRTSPRVTLNPRSSARRRRSSSSSTARRRPRSSRVLGGELDPRRWPAQLARRAGATWILDEAAASALGR